MSRTDNKTPFRVALTGGIASGKTTVANLFGDLGIPIIDTDVIAREVVAPGTEAIKLIRARFGDEVIDEDGGLQRSKMRRKVFADDVARRDLEAILHPRIGSEVVRQADEVDGEYQIIVVPLLVDSPLRQYVDRVLVVDCEENVQMERLLARDSETIEQARKILAAQSSRSARLDIADDVITNNLGLGELATQVTDLHQYYRSLAAR